MKTANEFTAKNSTKIQLFMENDQKEFVPNWTSRLVGDWVADIQESTGKKTLDLDIAHRKNFETFLVKCVNIAMKIELNPADYDFSGKYDRENPAPVKAVTKEVVADMTANETAIYNRILYGDKTEKNPGLLGDYTNKVAGALDIITTKILDPADPRKHYVKVSELKAGFEKMKVPEKIINAVVLKVQDHAAIEKTAAVVADFSFL